MRIYGQSTHTAQVHIMTWNNRKAEGRGERASERACVVRLSSNRQTTINNWNGGMKNGKKNEKKTGERTNETN